MNRIYIAVTFTFASAWYFMRRMKGSSINSIQSQYTVDTVDTYYNLDKIKYKYKYDGGHITSLYRESMMGYPILEKLVTEMLEDYMEKNKISTKYLILSADGWEAVIEFPDKSDTNYTVLTMKATNYYKK